MTSGLWSARQDALQALETTLRTEGLLLDESFTFIDAGVERLRDFASLSTEPERVLCAVTAPLAIKGRNLALACYSLSLDGLGQEAGAVLRPLLEVIELLHFLRIAPAHVEELLDRRLRKAGLIAEAVDSDFHELRNSLSGHASHLGLSDIALGHVIRPDATGALVLTVVQPFLERNCRINMQMALTFNLRLAIEVFNCANAAGNDMEDDVLDRFELFRTRCRDALPA